MAGGICAFSIFLTTIKEAKVRFFTT